MFLNSIASSVSWRLCRYLDGAFSVCGPLNRATTDSAQYIVLGRRPLGAVGYIRDKYSGRTHETGLVRGHACLICSLKGAPPAPKDEVAASPCLSLARVGGDNEYIRWLADLPGMFPSAAHAPQFALCDFEPSNLAELADVSSEIESGCEIHKLHAVAQLEAALRVLAPGGNCVVRVGDCHTRFVCSLLWILGRSFASFMACKPFTSPSLSPERFIVCRGLREGRPDFQGVLSSARGAIQRGECVLSLVPMQQLLQPDFSAYLMETNERLATRQITAMLHLQATPGPSQATGPDAV